MTGQLAVAEVLIEKGADVNSADAVRARSARN